MWLNVLYSSCDMTHAFRFEQLHRTSDYLAESALGQRAIELYQDCLNHPLVWLQNRHVFVATENSQLRGVANIEMQPNSGYAYLIGIAVAPAYRDKGIGRFMIQNLLQYATEHNCTHMQVIPRSDVEGFYARLGFVQRSENSMYWTHTL